VQGTGTPHLYFINCQTRHRDEREGGGEIEREKEKEKERKRKKLLISIVHKHDIKTSLK
jgi:hypothetical protein